MGIAIDVIEPDKLRFTWNNLIRPPDVDRLNTPTSLPGTPMTFALSEAPALWYGSQERHSADRPFIGPAQAHGYSYEPALGRAARELAEFYRIHRRLAPDLKLGTEFVLLLTAAEP